MAEVHDFEVEVGEIEAVEQAAEEKPAVAEAKPESPDDDLPEEFRGKSVKDLVGITLHARKEMGRQANELGEIRKLADELLKSQLKPKEPEPVAEVDFFDNPQEAIRRAVENNPKVLQAEQIALQAQRAQAQQKLAQLHPDFGQVVQDPEFATWIQGSRVRAKLFQEAEAYDVDAADELLSTFKQLKAVKVAKQQSVVSETEKTARKDAMQAAAVDTGGSGESGRKVYRRADLIRLRMTDPDRYDAMNDEILSAYREGRVK